MRWGVSSVVPSVLFEPDAAVAVSATDGGFFENVEVLNASVLLAVSCNKIHEQGVRGQSVPAVCLIFHDYC